MSGRMIEIPVGPHPTSAVDVALGLNIGSSTRSSAVTAVSGSDRVLTGPGANFKVDYPFGAAVTLISNIDIYYHFQSFASVVSAASETNSYFLPAGVHKDWWCRPGWEDVIVFIRAGSSDGRLWRVQTNI